jgi:hypothetical protein
VPQSIFAPQNLGIIQRARSQEVVNAPAEIFEARDGVDAALSPTASQCAKLVMLKSQGKREGIHEGN